MKLWIEITVSGLITGGIYALVAMGLNLQYGLMRVLNIAHGELLMLAAYLTWIAHAALGVDPLAFLPAVFLVMFAGGVLLYLLCFRRLARISPNPDVFEERSMLAGFGLLYILQNIAYLIWGGQLRGYRYLDDPVRFAGLVFTENRLIAFLCTLAVSVLFIVLLRATLIGKAVRALMQAPMGAQLVGIDVDRLHPVVFGLGVAMAGVSGALLSMMFEISPAMGGPYTVIALIVITLGGLGSFTGSLFGGLLLGVIEVLGAHFTSPSLQLVLSYGVFVAVMIARPRGLFAR